MDRKFNVRKLPLSCLARRFPVKPYNKKNCIFIVCGYKLDSFSFMIPMKMRDDKSMIAAYKDV